MMYCECVKVSVAPQKIVTICNKKSKIQITSKNRKSTLKSEEWLYGKNFGFEVFPQYTPVYLKLVLGRLSQLLGCWRLDS